MWVYQRNQNIKPLVKVSLVLKASFKQTKLFKIGGKMERKEIQATSYNGAPIDRTSYSFLRKYILSYKRIFFDDKWFRPIVNLHLAKFDHSLTCQNLILAFLHNNVHEYLSTYIFCYFPPAFLLKCFNQPKEANKQIEHAKKN